MVVAREKVSMTLLWCICALLVTGCAPTGAGAQVADACYTAVPLKDSAGNDKPIEPICRALEKNLNQFCDEPPLVCQLKIAPAFSSALTIPELAPADFGGDLGLIEALVRAPFEHLNNGADAAKIWDDYRPRYEAALRSGRLKVSRGVFDIYRIGRPMNVYRVDPGDCEVRNAAQLQNESREEWDLQLANAGVFVYPAAEEIGALQPQRRALGVPPGDLFLYEGLPYLYSMGVLRRNPAIETYNTVVVYAGSDDLASSGLLSIRDICEINYRAKRSER
jgi:hypothetical protein